MDLKTIIIRAIITAAMLMARSSAAEQSEGYPVIAYAAPTERSPGSLHAPMDRIVFHADERLYSTTGTTASNEEGIIVVWRERVFGSLAGHMTIDTADGGRMVARIAVKESLKLAVEHLPTLERLMSVLKFEVSTKMLAGDDADGEGDERPSASEEPKLSRAMHQEARSRFFLKTGLRIPVEQGRPALLSETNAVYGTISTYFKMRLDGKFDSRLGIRYGVGPEMQVQVERTTAGSADPDPTGTARHSVSNTVRVVCMF